MHQVEVQIFQAQVLQRHLEGVLRLSLAVVFEPQLGGDEELLAGDVQLGESLAEGFLVVVARGGVD